METFSALLAFLRGIHRSPVISAHKWIFDVFFDLHLSQQLSKQWRRRSFETPSRSWWRHGSVFMSWLIIISNYTLPVTICVALKPLESLFLYTLGIHEIKKSVSSSNAELYILQNLSLNGISRYFPTLISRGNMPHRNRIGWLCLVPTSTTRFASDLG